ncbi:MAG: type II secretion system F family protein [Candidatus Woesearchaeota archaeon]
MVSLIRRLGITFSRLLPKKHVQKFTRTIHYTGKDEAQAEFILGVLNMVGVFIILASVLLFYAIELPTQMGEDEFGLPQEIPNEYEPYKFLVIILGIIVYLFLLFAVHLVFFLIKEKRKTFVENVLPDALFMIASNMKSGETPFHAVKSSIRPEFGPLAEAFDLAITRSLGSTSFSDSLLQVGDTIDSEILQRSMKLFSTAIRSGSRVSMLLEDIANDVISRQTLKKEMVTNTKTNSMFIIFMVVIAAPFLMSISIFFSESMGSFRGDAGTGGESVGGLGGGDTVSSEFLTLYAYAFLFLTGIMASYFSATMVEGDGRNGLKKAPLIIAASYGVFFMSQYLINTMLGGMF